MRIDPAQYVQDGGWDWDAIAATAEHGLAAEDRYRIEAWHTRHEDGNDIIDWAAVEQDEDTIYQYCIDRVREETA